MYSNSDLSKNINLSVITTAPTVLYKIKLVHTTNIITIESPSDFPETHMIEEILEPVINATIIVPKQYLGNLLKLCEEKRGIQQKFKLS